VSKAWHEVARLGGTGVRYPHILVDAHGWCLRWGGKSRLDDKYYSSLPVLLHGLVEHGVRRRGMALSTALEIKELCREVKDALQTALELCHETLLKGGLEEHMRRLGASKASPPTLAPPRTPEAPQGGRQAARPPEPRREAV
jgi:hypothetical protein